MEEHSQKSSQVLSQTAKSTKTPFDQMTHEDLVKHVKRQLMLLQKTKAKCDELTAQCTELERQRDEALAQKTSSEELSKDGQIEELKSKVLELTEAKHEAESAYKSIQETQDAHFQHFQELEAKFNSLCIECQELEKELQATREESKTFRRRCHAAEEKNECLEMKLETLTSTCACLQDEVTKMQNDKKDLQDQVDVLTDARDSALETIASFKIKTRASEENLEKVGSLEKRVEELTDENRTLTERLEKATDVFEALARERDDLETSNKSMQIILDKSQKELEKALEECESWKLRCDKYENEKIPELENKLEEMSSQMKMMEDKLCSGVVAVESRYKETEIMLRSKYEEVLKESEVKDNTIKKMKEEENKLTQKNSLLEENGKKLTEELQDFASKVKKLESELVNAVDQKQEALDELFQAKELQKFIEQELRGTKEENKRMKVQTSGLQADLENDHLHILKLENELAEACIREKVLRSEVEKLKESCDWFEVHDSNKVAERLTEHSWNQLLQIRKEFKACKEKLEAAVTKDVLKEIASFEINTKESEGSSKVVADVGRTLELALETVTSYENESEKLYELIERFASSIQKRTMLDTGVQCENTNSNEELDEKLVALQEERDALTTEKSLLLRQIDGLTSTIEQLELHVASFKDIVPEKIVTSNPPVPVEELLQKIKVLEENLGEKTRMIDTIHCRLDDLLTRNEELVWELDEKEKDLEEAERTICELENSVSCLKMDVASKNALVAYLENSLASLKDAPESVRAFDADATEYDETSAARDEAAVSENPVSEKQIETSLLLEKVENQEEEIKSLKSQLLEQSYLLETEAEERLKAKNERSAINLELNSALERVRVLEKELETSLENYAAMQIESKNFEDELENIKKELEMEKETGLEKLTSAKNENKKLKEELNKKEAMISELNDDLEMVQKQVELKVAEISKQETDIAVLKEKLETAQLKSDKELEMLKIENVGLIEKLKAFEDSSASKSVSGGEMPKQEQPEHHSREVVKLGEALKEAEDRMNKFKLVAVKVKKELAETRKKFSEASEERNKLKQELEQVSSTSLQHLHNFQVLQMEYDKLQDEHEALKGANKQMEQDLLKVVTELGEMRKQSSELKEEMEHVKKLLEVASAEKKAADMFSAELEGKLIVLASEKATQQEQFEQIKTTLGKTENQLKDLEEQLRKEQEQHLLTTQQLNRIAKEAQQHSVLNLEMADYERTVSEMTEQLDRRDKEIAELKEQLDKEKENVSSLQLEIEHLDKQRSSEEDRANNLKQLLLKAKDELSASRNNEQELRKRVSELQAQVELLNMQAEHCKLQLTECMSGKEQLNQSLRSCREAHQKATRMLEQKISLLEEELQTCRVELESKSAEFENYKVRVCNVLKQQKKPEPIQDLVHKENIEKLQKTVEQLRTRIQELTDQLQASTAENDALHDDHNRLLQRHTKIIEELHAKDRLWSERLENISKEKDALNIEICELKQQLFKQKEIVANTFKQLYSCKESHQQTVDLLQKQLDAADKEIVRLQKENQKTGFAQTFHHPQQQEETLPFDVLTQERQEGEGSECTNTGSITPVKQLSFATIPTGGFVPLDQLIQSAGEPSTPTSASSHQDVDSLSSSLLTAQKRLEHLNELLNESEANNLRLSEQSRLLKEEIRRLERNKEREKHAENLEYLKNVVIKFITLRGSDERERLIPVLTTMLRLSPDEQGQLQALTDSDAANGNQQAEGWGSYLHRWSGIA